MKIESLGRRTRLIGLGVILIIAGIIIPSLYYSAYYNLLTGKVTSYDFPLLPYGAAVAILGVIIVAVGLIVKDETTSAPQARAQLA